DQAVDQPAVERLLCADGVARRTHFERSFDSRDARQPLRPTRAGQKPELHLGRAELRARVRYPIVAAERHLQASAKRGPMDRRNDGLAAILDRSEEHTSELQSLAYLVCRLL